MLGKSKIHKIENILVRFSILNTNLETLIHKVNLQNVVSTKKPSFSKYVFLFQKNTPDSHICIMLGKSKIHKIEIPSIGLCTLFINVEIKSMENIISIKEPKLSKNGFSFRKLYHNTKYVF